MKIMRRKNIERIFLIILLLAAFLLNQYYGSSPSLDKTDKARQEADLPFDYYVAALSWSPTYCADSNSASQCRTSKPYGFILHGLWPQFNNGWPEYCETGYKYPSQNEIKSMLDITPSYGLIKHQWEKHGTCSGKDAQAYFQTAHAVLKRINIPANFQNLRNVKKLSPKAIEDAFLNQNNGFNADGVTVTCKKGRLQEVRICFDKTLQPTACMGTTRKDCGQKQIIVPAMK